jgi:LmeA-like phospholipid-binding
MHRMAILAVAALIAVLAVAIQLGLPRLAERKAAQRLTEGGGHARVHVKAFPATDLLRKRGDSLVVKASGLVAAGGERGGGGLEDLDGFTHVDIQVIGVRLGPLTISRFHLNREVLGEPYQVTVQATVTPEDMARYAGGRVGGFLTAALVGAGTEIPLDVEAILGRDGATAVRGSVAGLPAGPLVEALVAGLASRL